MTLKRLLPILFLVVLFSLAIYFKIYQYLSFNSLKIHRDVLQQWVTQRYLLSTLIFIGIYALAVAISIPGASLLTLTGGFLFGTVLGSIYVVLGATLGATVIFLAAKNAFAEILERKAGPFLQRFKRGFSANALNYLLVLRLIPIFPFWLINIVPAFLNVRLSTYFTATLLGIIPGTIIYVSLGSGLGALLDNDQTPDLSIILQAHILWPLIGLAILSLLPIIYNKLTRNTTINQ